MVFGSQHRILVDAKLGHASGGLGVAFDWTRARPVLTAQPSLRVIVAGGLRPENVAQAITQLQPYGVDVASGVEQTPGMKDPEKLRQFLQAARGRDLTPRGNAGLINPDSPFSS